jgi:hypothetical protein
VEDSIFWFIIILSVLLFIWRNVWKVERRRHEQQKEEQRRRELEQRAKDQEEEYQRLKSEQQRLFMEPVWKRMEESRNLGLNVPVREDKEGAERQHNAEMVRHAEKLIRAELRRVQQAQLHMDPDVHPRGRVGGSGEPGKIRPVVDFVFARRKLRPDVRRNAPSTASGPGSTLSAQVPTRFSQGALPQGQRRPSPSR